MIEIMDSINNHFIRDTERGIYQFTENSIKGNFTKTYLAGMYVIVKSSFLNDGIYEIESVGNDEVVVKELLKEESTEETTTLYTSTPSIAFTELVGEIKGFDESKIGIASESIDDYSVSYSEGQSWQEVYKAKLNQYRKIYTDMPSDNPKIRWQDRW